MLYNMTSPKKRIEGSLKGLLKAASSNGSAHRNSGSRMSRCVVLSSLSNVYSLVNTKMPIFYQIIERVDLLLINGVTSILSPITRNFTKEEIRYFSVFDSVNA